MEYRKIVLGAFLLLFMTVSSGCSLITKNTYVRGYLPIIPKPERPAIPTITKSDLDTKPKETATKLVNSVKDLQTYARQLEVGVDKYNDFATEENNKTDKIVGISK